MNPLEQAVLKQTGLSRELFKKTGIRVMSRFHTKKEIDAFYIDHRVSIMVYLRQEAFKEGCSLSEYVYRRRGCPEVMLSDIEDTFLGIPTLCEDWVVVDITLSLLKAIQRNI